MKSLWRHISFNYQRGGLFQVFAKLCQRMRQWSWSESAWLIYELGQGEHQAPTIPLRHLRLTLSNLRELKYFKVLSFPEAIEKRLKSGAICHGFFIDDQLAHIAWTTAGYLELEPAVKIVRQDYSGIYDCYTLPNHRSKGVYRSALVQLAEEALRSGPNVVLIAVDLGNIPSITGIERAGFKPLHKMRVRRRFGCLLPDQSEFCRRTKASESGRR